MIITGKNNIGFGLTGDTNDTFHAINPATGQQLDGKFYSATTSDIDNAVKLASQAFEIYKGIDKDKKADFLEKIADEIMALGDALIERAMLESGLPQARLTGERGRTVNQLKMFAALVREGTWVEAAIDTAIPDRSPVPKPDLRKMMVPLGTVVVFGASNFPLAYSTAGGDTASALAGGNPVIVKAHNSHPGTSELIALAIINAAISSGMPEGIFSHVQDSGFHAGNQLVSHPGVKAVGFTGSFSGGKALYSLAQKRKTPIPVFAEMGSVNPVFLLPGAMDANPEKMAEQYAGSITLGAGQFCTNPGLLIGLNSEALQHFADALGNAISDTKASVMLNKGMFDNYRNRKSQMLEQNGIETITDTQDDNSDINAGNPVVAAVKASDFIANPTLHEEVFGPYSLLVRCNDRDELTKVVANMPGQLTVTVMATERDLREYSGLIHLLREKAGRLILNGVPTGVEVCPSMQHGGPYPATTDVRFTSVGTAAIKRFVRPLSFQNWPETLLPPELHNDNPMDIWRLVNGSYTKDKIE